MIAIAEIRLVTSPFALAPGAGFSLRRVARVSDGVEAGLLLVAQGIVEALEGRAHEADRPQHGIETLCHGIEPRKRSCNGIDRAGCVQHLDSIGRGSLELEER